MDIVISFCSCWWNNGNDVTLCGNCKTKTKIPVYVEQAAELVVAGNTQLNKDSLVIMGSKSGDTKDCSSRKMVQRKRSKNCINGH